MTWRVESSPSASSTRTGIIGSIRVSLLDPSAAVASASSSPSPSSKSTTTTFTTSATPPPIFDLRPQSSPEWTPTRRQPPLSLFSHSAVATWKLEAGRNRNWWWALRNQMPVCERTTKPKRRGLYTYTPNRCHRQVGHVPAGPADQWALEAVAGGHVSSSSRGRGHEISAATRPVGAPATSGDREVWPAGPMFRRVPR